MLESMLEIITGKSKKDKAIDFVSCVLIGTIIGGVAGVLLAPTSGKETRDDLKEKSKEISESIKGIVEEKIEEFNWVDAKKDIK